MSRRLAAFAVVVAASLAATSDRVAACSCIGLPACARMDGTPPAAAFVGQVTDLEAMENGQFRVRLQVIERFVGNAEGQLDLYTGPNTPAGCAYFPFNAGETYLVYASRNAAGQLSTGICTGTAPLERVPESDLAYLRAGVNDSGLATIQGTVTRYLSAPGAQAIDSTPYEGARIVATGAGQQYEGRSGTDGSFQIAVPPGNYRLVTEVPDGLYAELRVVDLKGTRGCAVTSIGVRDDGRLSGRLTDSRGLPVPYMTVEARPAEAPGVPPPVSTSYRATTDLDGRYEIAQLPPGTYAVEAVTRAQNTAARQVGRPSQDAAAAAPVASIGSGERVAVAPLALPAGLELVTIMGTVRNDAGQPLEGTNVMLWPQSAGGSQPLTHPVATDATGMFRITAPVGSYRLRAEAGMVGGRARRADVRFDASAATPALDVVIP